MCSNHDGIKLEINRIEFRKALIIWKLNNTLKNTIHIGKEEIRKLLRL